MQTWIVRTEKGYIGTTPLSYPLLRDDRTRDEAFRYITRQVAEEIAARFSGTVEES